MSAPAPSAPLGATPLQPYANARLLLHVHQLPGRFDSPRLGRLVAEAFLARQRPVLETNQVLGLDAGDFSYQGYLCRCALLPDPPTNPWDWLASTISWSQIGLRAPLASGEYVQAPAMGDIWLGELASLSSPTGALPAGNRGQLAGLTVTEFGGIYGAGGIGALTQPLLGERLELVLKPNRIAVIQAGDTLLTIAERYGTTVDTLRSVNPDLLGSTTISTADAGTIDGIAVVAGDRVLVKDQTAGAENGIYLAAAGSWSRAPDFDSSSDAFSGAHTSVQKGSTLAGTFWQHSTAPPITLGVTPLTFAQITTSGSFLTSKAPVLVATTGPISRSGASDTLNGLAEAYGTTVSWLRDQPENSWLLQSQGHTVTTGETLTSLAELYGTTRRTLRKLNPSYADDEEWPGDRALPAGAVLLLFAIRPSSPLPAAQPLLVPLYRPSTPLSAGSWLLLPRRRAAAAAAAQLLPDL
jgi:hypothetical protein